MRSTLSTRTMTTLTNSSVERKTMFSTRKRARNTTNLL